MGRCERASVRSATKSKEMAFDLMSLVNKTAALEKKCSVMEGHSARLLSQYFDIVNSVTLFCKFAMSPNAGKFWQRLRILKI